MEDLKTLTLRILRQLARKHLLRGYSRLKKAELVSALAKCMSHRSSRSAKLQVAAPRRVRAEASRAASVAKLPRAPEPLVEGFFVARVAGEREAQLRRTDQAPGLGEKNARDELPVAYGDDALHLLPRDPRTLFVFWNFDARVWDRAAAGLKWARSVLRVFETGTLVREVEVSLEARSFYLHDLPPGRTYHVEAHFVSEGQPSRRIGRPSNAVALPGPGHLPSPGEVRFLRVPWELPLRDLKDAIGRGQARLETLSPEQAEALGALPVLGTVRVGDASSERQPGVSGGRRWNPSGQST